MVPPPVHRRSARVPALVWVILAVIVLGVGFLFVASAAKPSHLMRDTQELNAAMDQAKKELQPKFVAALRKGEPDARFFVRATFKSRSGPETLWVKDVSLQGDDFAGTLDEEPALYREKKRGDAVTVPQSAVVDWVIKRGSQIEGGYTTKLTTQGAG